MFEEFIKVLGKDTVSRVINNVGFKRAASVLGQLVGEASRFQYEKGAGPSGVARLGENVGRHIRPTTGMGGFANIGLLNRLSAILTAGTAGWQTGRTLGKSPLLTDPNTTYDEYYQNLFGKYINNTQNRNQGWKDTLMSILNSGNAYAAENKQVLPQQDKRMSYNPYMGETQIPFIPFSVADQERFSGYDPNSEDRFKYYK